MQFPAFVGGSFPAQSLLADAERTKNLYTEIMESAGANAKKVFYQKPGVDSIVTHTTGPGRAHISIAGREFAVIGTDFVEIGEFGVLTDRGDVSIDSNPATISSNGDGGGQLFITSGSNGYCYDLDTDVLTQIAALNGKASMGGMLDGFFLALDTATSTMYISDLLDGLTWDPTQFAQRSKQPDPWVSMKVLNQYIWLLGSQTSEIWYDAGTSPFPFAPHPSGLLSYGCAAGFSPDVFEGEIAWLAATASGQGQIMRASGFAPEQISSQPLENEIGQYITISDAIGFSFRNRGHTFYILTFPTPDATWVWDSSTGDWLEWPTWISEDAEFVAWRAIWPVFAFGETRMLDASTGDIYRLGSDIKTDVNGRPIRWLRQSPAIIEGNERIYYQSFELLMEVGLGNSNPSGEDPQVMLRLSNDGGKTWGAELWRSAGKIGEYGKRVRWERLGMARKRVVEVSGSDPVFSRIIDAFIELGQSYPGQRRGRAD